MVPDATTVGPGRRLAGTYAYTPDRLAYFVYSDPRDQALQDALKRCLRSLPAM